MRQLLKISLFFIYLFLNAGMSYSLHYCSEKLEAINFYTENKKCCAATEENNDCCEDVFSLDQQNSEQTQSPIVDFQFQKSDINFALTAFSALLNSLLFSSDTESKLSLPDQLYSPQLPLHIKNQTFLI